MKFSPEVINSYSVNCSLYVRAQYTFLELLLRTRNIGVPIEDFEVQNLLMNNSILYFSVASHFRGCINCAEPDNK